MVKLYLIPEDELKGYLNITRGKLEDYTMVPEWATHFARKVPLDDWEPYSDPEHVFQLKEIEK